MKLLLKSNLSERTILTVETWDVDSIDEMIMQSFAREMAL